MLSLKQLRPLLASVAHHPCRNFAVKSRAPVAFKEKATDVTGTPKPDTSLTTPATGTTDLPAILDDMFSDMNRAFANLQSLSSSGGFPFSSPQSSLFGGLSPFTSASSLFPRRSSASFQLPMEMAAETLGAMDISRSATEYKIKVDLPGVDADKIHVDVDDDNYLNIRAERKSESEERDTETGDIIRWGRQFGDVSRSISLPRDSEGEKVAAKFINGVLEVVIPRGEVEGVHVVNVETT